MTQQQLKWKLLTGRGSTDTILRKLKILVSFKYDFEEYLHVLFSLELEYYAGVSRSYISGCLWKSWPHKFVLEGAYGGFWSKLLLEAGSAYEIKLGCSRFYLGESCKPARTETAQSPWATSVLCGPCGDP